MKKQTTLEYIHKNNFVASKKMGQNFLINKDIKTKIVNQADLDENTLVIEIGPGLGAISEIILKTSYLLAIELDKRLYSHLSEMFKNEKKFHIMNCDFLTIDLNEIVNSSIFNRTFNKIVVIANLPYSISSLILAKLITYPFIDYAILMVQKEMALRVCAKQNEKDYNAFSVWLQEFCSISFLFDVKPDNFIPKPKVMSSVIKLIINQNHYDKQYLSTFKSFLNKCFSCKRKTIYNNLKPYYDQTIILNALNELMIDKNIRPQNISKEQYKELLEVLKG